MPRGNRAERWRPRQVHAMVTPEARARAKAALEMERDRAEAMKPGLMPWNKDIINAAIGSVMQCIHGNPWMTCTHCGPIRVPR